MAVICLLGEQGVGKTSLLQSTIQYLSDDKPDYRTNYYVHKEDFSGEANTLGENKEVISSTTIHPNRVIIKDYNSNKMHQIFSVGGRYKTTVVKMSIITISKLSDHIIFVFSPGINLETQFEYFDNVKLLPKELYVCINKMDLFNGHENGDEFKDFKKNIEDYLTQKTLSVKEFFFTYSNFKTNLLDLQLYRENTIKMFLKIISN